MTNAEIIGWGKCVPPAVLSNDDLSTAMETSDEWIRSRTGIARRHISHVPVSEMARVAAERAIACAGIDPGEIDLVMLGTTTPDSIAPNSASFVTNAIGASKAAAMDVNSACTSWIYAMTAASSMIKAGNVRTALVVGMERTSRMIDWGRRESCVLFGDGGGAVVLQASEEPLGLLHSSLSTVPGTRELIDVPDWGVDMPRSVLINGIYTTLEFSGQEIFKKAVLGMLKDCRRVMEKAGVTIEDVDLLIPHQANLRILEAVGKRLGIEHDKVVLRVDEYGNTSAGSIPLALCDALEAEKLKPGMLLLMPTFGSGLTSGAVLVRWGDRVTPLGHSQAELPPCEQTGLELIMPSIEAARKHYGDS